MNSTPISVVIPAYNEEAIVADVLTEVRQALDEADIEHELIVVDDGSTDRTGERARSAGATVLVHRTNRGYGASLKTGILAARYEAICILDADGTYPADRLPELVAEYEHADMVVGARIGRSVAIPLVRRPAKWCLNLLANYITQTKIPDLNSGMRLFDRDTAIEYFNILSDQFSFTTTITISMLCDKYAVKYVPIDYAPRVGKSKIVPWDAASFLILILRVAMLFRPLRVFIPCALVSFLYAVVKANWDLFITGDRNVSTTAAIAMLCAFQLTLIGGLGDALATRLRHISRSVRASVLPEGRHRKTAAQRPATDGDEGPLDDWDEPARVASTHAD